LEEELLGVVTVTLLLELVAGVVAGVEEEADVAEVELLVLVAVIVAAVLGRSVRDRSKLTSRVPRPLYDVGE
jgi:uncharacterized membrane protein YoaK (UPF0700 family)